MSTLAEIESLTRTFADQRQKLLDRVQTLQAEMEAAKRRHMAGIRKALADTTEAQSRLHNAIDGARHLFLKPRSVVVAGIKVGIQKGKGTVTWDDPEVVANAIEFEMAGQLDAFVKTTRRPIVEALLKLEEPTLKRLHCRLIPGKDDVLIKPTGGELDRFLNALMADVAEQAAETADEEAA